MFGPSADEADETVKVNIDGAKFPNICTSI